MPNRMRSARTPDTISLLVVLAVVGAILTAAGFIPPALDRLAPDWAGLLWGTILSVSAFLSVLGILWPDELTGWVLELAGRPGVLTTCLGYSMAMVLSMGENYGTALAVAFFGGFAFSSGWRIYQLLHDLRTFQAALKLQRGSRRGA